LLDALAHGEFALAGFRNKDLRQHIHPTTRRRSVDDERRLSARISRQLRLLRDHGLIRKVPKSYRYRLTDKGRTLVAALQAVRNASLERLGALAA
jgi:DNA-binding HxlR family transcriptional regulator